MYKVYQVQAGDTIDSVARFFMTVPDEIKSLNGIVGDVTLRTGGFLIVPVREKGLFEMYTVKKGDNMYAIARTFDVDYDTLLEINGLDPEDYIYPDQEILIPKKGVKTYRVKNGDTITSVTRDIKLDYECLAKFNPDIYLEQGQILFYE